MKKAGHLTLAQRSKKPTRRSVLAQSLALAALVAFCPMALPAWQTGAGPGGTASASAQAEAPDTNAPPGAPAAAAGNQPPRTEKRKPARIDRQAIVVTGRDAELKADESAEVIVVLGGSAKVHGKVRQYVVVIGGDIEVDGEVDDNVVAILGSVRIGQGADLRRDVLSVMGSVNVEPKATVGGDVTVVGGQLDVAEGADVKGERVELGMNLAWLKQWIRQCLFKLRPLSPEVGWVWVVAGAFFLFYLLVAAALPRPVRACVEVLNDRPGTTIVLGILAKLLVPILFIILVATGVGLLIVPFLALALFVGVLIGKVALLEWVGLSIGHQSGVRSLQRPLPAFVMGSIILTLFYMIWVVGLLAYIGFGIWGLGVAVTAVMGHVRRKRAPEPSAPSQPAAPEPAPATAAMAAAAAPAWTSPAMASAPAWAPTSPSPAPAAAAPPAPAWTPAASEAAPAQAVEPEPPQAQAMPAPPAAPPEALIYPRAGFWDRIGAAFLDIVVVSVLDLFIPGPWWLLWLIALAYFAGMWAWRGTTVGGTVVGLKVVRLDGRPMSFMVAMVRGLGAAFSILVMGLGYLWIAWDAEKQGWHDRIAGTVVVRLPRGTPLV